MVPVVPVSLRHHSSAVADLEEVLLGGPDGSEAYAPGADEALPQGATAPVDLDDGAAENNAVALNDRDEQGNVRVHLTTTALEYDHRGPELQDLSPLQYVCLIRRTAKPKDSDAASETAPDGDEGDGEGDSNSIPGLAPVAPGRKSNRIHEYAAGYPLADSFYQQRASLLSIPGLGRFPAWPVPPRRGEKHSNQWRQQANMFADAVFATLLPWAPPGTPDRFSHGGLQAYEHLAVVLNDLQTRNRPAQPQCPADATADQRAAYEEQCARYYVDMSTFYFIRDLAVGKRIPEAVRQGNAKWRQRAAQHWDEPDVDADFFGALGLSKTGGCARDDMRAAAIEKASREVVNEDQAANLQRLAEALVIDRAVADKEAQDLAQPAEAKPRLDPVLAAACDAFKQCIPAITAVQPVTGDAQPPAEPLPVSPLSPGVQLVGGVPVCALSSEEVKAVESVISKDPQPFQPPPPAQPSDPFLQPVKERETEKERERHVQTEIESAHDHDDDVDGPIDID